MSNLRSITIDLMKEYEIAKYHDKPIKLSSGKYSDFYVDMRKAAGIPVLFNNITGLASDYLINKGFDQLIGIELFGSVYAHAIGMKTGINTSTIRKEVKKHGTGKLLEGYLDKPNKILLIDDVLTTGTSILKALDNLSNNKIEDVFVLVDRQEEGRDILLQHGIKLYNLFTKNQLI